MAGVVLAYSEYQDDLTTAKERTATGYQLINTPCGSIQYAESGQGPPILVIHGAGGGFDQGMSVAHWYLPKHRIIAPSRFGYLQTPLASNASPAAQAEAHACLLDALKLDEVTVVGVSAGALSSMQLAIKHPGRVSSLVLLVPAAWAPGDRRHENVLHPSQATSSTQQVASNKFVDKVVLKSDVAMWLFTKIARRQMMSFLGLPRKVQENLTAEQDQRISELIQSIFPVSHRQAGIVNDRINHQLLERYTLEDIHAPTLVIDAADVGTFPGSKYTAENIQDAKFVAFETGGHFLIGHEEETRVAIEEFLKPQTMAEKRTQRTQQ